MNADKKIDFLLRADLEAQVRAAREARFGARSQGRFELAGEIEE